MGSRRNPLLALALSAAMLFAGCVGTQGDADLEANATQAELSVNLAAENVDDVSHLGLEVDRVLVHDANVSLPDGFHELSVQAGHADLVHDGEATTVELASGSLPAGTYDQVLLRLDNATVKASGNASGGHGHDHGHDHGDGGNESSANETEASTVSTGSLALPLNVTFEVTPDQSSEVTFTLDAKESFDGDSLEPSFANAEVVRGNETVATETDLETRADPSDRDLPSDPPAVRISVFAPNGDQVLAPDFDPKEGEFANSISSGFPAGEAVQFVGTESEPVAKGAAIETYEWDFGDGTTATGATASHVYEEAGVYEVELTVTDSYGNVDSHTVRVVTVAWTQTVANSSFEGESEWTDETPDGEVNEWRLAEPGHGNSSTAWHVGLSEDSANASDAGYGPTNEPVRLVSPTFSIPESFEIVGYELFVDGYASSGQLELLLHTEEDTRTLGVVSDEAEWKRFGGLDALEDVAGKDVQFEAVFTADADPFAKGPGYAIDEFTLAGMAKEDLVNHELLDEASGGHGGHDHEH